MSETTLPGAGLGTGAGSMGSVVQARDDRLSPMMDVPVTLRIVLGVKKMHLSSLFALSRGSVVEIDKKVGEPVDIFVNDRLVARGEVQLTDEGRLAVSMTEVASSGLHG